MKNTIKLTRTQGIAIVAILGLLVTWAAQTASSAYQRGVAEGKSIRVAEINSCSVSNVATNAHFSGCNSIL